MSIGPIPITAMFAYVDRFGLPEWSMDALMRIDQDWLELLSKEDGKHD